MPTRLKRPSIIRQLLVTIALAGFIAYLGYSAFEGQYGYDSRQQMLIEIDQLQAEDDGLKSQISEFRHKNALFDPQRLDPDILTEKARSLLSMVNKDDLVVELPTAN